MSSRSSRAASGRAQACLPSAETYGCPSSGVDGPLSAFLLRRSPDESWLPHLSPREQAVPGHTDPQDQLRTVRFLLQESRKKVSELHRYGTSPNTQL